MKSIISNLRVLVISVFSMFCLGVFAIPAPIGMELNKKVKKKEVPQLLNYPSAELSEYRMHGGEVVIKGHILVPEEAKGEKIPEDLLNKMNGVIKVIMRDYIVRKEKTQLIEFNPDGTFTLNVRLPYPMFLLVHPVTMVYACPGDTLEMTLDPTKRKREEAFTWDGTGLSGEVTKLYDKIRTTYCDFPERDNIHEKGPDSLMTWRDLQVASLDDMVRKMNTGLPELKDCSPLASDILRTYIISQHLEHICRYYMLTDMENIDRETYWQQFFSFVAPREKYLLDNPLLMIAGDEFFFNYVENTVMRPMHGRVLNYMPFDYDPKIAEAISQEKIVYSREFKRNAMNKLNDKLIRRAILTYRDYVKEKEIKVVEQKPMTKGDSIFQRIIEPYKGNVLYVDFWEMSCGPCRATMLHMRDKVEANKDKPVKYLYITDDTPEHCKSFLEPNNIQGEHIHITRSEWGYLQEKFQFSGIPFVLLFDKQGKQRENVTVEQLLNE